MSGKKRRPDWYVFYRQQRGNAKLRGIIFQLTAEEWWQIWAESGHLHERGQKANQYCMARFGDVGPYAVNNIEIITNSQNNRQGSTGRLHTEETKQKISLGNLGELCT